MPPCLSHKKPGNHQSWSLGTAIILGALVGASAGAASQIIHVLDPPRTDLAPFLHTLEELLIAAVVGASTFAVVAATRNRLFSKRSRSIGTEGKLSQTT